MPGTCARFFVLAAGLTCALLAPCAARADDLSEKIELDLLRLQAQELVKAADQKTSGGEAQFTKAGEIYESAYRRFCGRSGPANRFVPDPQTCTEIAYNAAHAFRAAHDSSKAIGMYRMLVQDDERRNAHSPLAIKATYLLGAEYQTLALYDQAAEWYERFATRYPAAQEADVALKDAVILRLGLAQDEQAVTDAQTYVKHYGAKRPAEAATVMYAIAAHHGEREQWDRARVVIASAMPLFDKASIDIQVVVHALLARAHTHGPTPAVAKEEYAKVRAFWKDPAAAEAAIRRAAQDDDEARKDRRVARALNAVGEALFAAAEDRRLAEVETLKFPTYVGPAQTAAVQAHIQTKVRPWYEKKKTAIEGVEPAFIQILDLRPVPPPKWVIAAGATVGAMWGSFADDFRRVPIPDAWRNDRTLYRAYWDAIEDVSGAMKTRNAKPAMKKCIDLAVKYQFQDARTRVCEGWLAKNYKSEFHLVDEIVPAFRSGSGPAEGRPFSYEGEIFRAALDSARTHW
jgi:TolA-binding protein